MENLRGTTAFITGGARGIGLGIARALAGRGVRMALADIDAMALDAAKNELATRAPDAGSVQTFELDVRDRAAFAAVADQAEQRLGPVSLLINNAGVSLGLRKVSEQVTYPIWDYITGVNVDGVNNGVQTFLPRMLSRGGPGHIVNTASVAGLGVFPGRSAAYGYTASKAAVIALTETLHHGLRDEGAAIGASVLLPGLVATAITTNSLHAAPDDIVPPGERARVAELARQGAEIIAVHGRDIDTVGEQVVEGILDNRLYILTDRMAAGVVASRARAIIDAMPAEDGRTERVLDLGSGTGTARDDRSSA
ncbi:SDR family NAD(P)-dependent oxidoreductase [Nonomuraea mesophila]|uniref:SDR family NAD(P)-dependent oxidoreductase n=1 Tax=Nonomuraea mesophila TaxID=2530382 RepID=A0A4R5F914_9ACTN|nr:SDR family NAD(P)-dependent oxidoreductase [Nonomuraea mesophila]TDE44784.1 SDR family NAD(P)-dependent oxidoreductase [Nonomuraea mesophila]